MNTAAATIYGRFDAEFDDLPLPQRETEVPATAIPNRIEFVYVDGSTSYHTLDHSSGCEVKNECSGGRRGSTRIYNNRMASVFVHKPWK